MTDRLYLFATIRVKPQHLDAARAALDDLMIPTLGEPGCHVFAAFASRDEDNTLHLVECFDDEAALTAHYAEDYTKAVFAAYADWLAAPIEAKRMSALSATSARQFVS
ncbi:MAG: antibiotic biosynthesis monooxygenase [Rhodobacteraceae bacterium]|nr:antibiotic biosynthesis monooxygenase [Paracoccaceae bacterium]